MTIDSEICVVTHPLSAAGENATRTLLDILSAITAVSLVTADLPRDSTIRDNHDVVEITSKGANQSNIAVAAARFLRNQVRMCRAISKNDAEIVLFFGATSYLLPVAFCRILGKTVVIEPRGDIPLTLQMNWERKLPGPLAQVLAKSVWALERTCYHLADAIITYTPSMASELGLSDFEEKLYPNGARYIDVNKFDIRTPYEDRDRIVGFLGRLDQEKNVRMLAEAAVRLPEDVTFRFVGDGPLREELEVIAGNDPTIEFTGWVEHDEVPAELNQMRLLVLPSQPTEGLPTTILESLACGTPVLSTPVAGVPDVVREGKTGFYLRSEAPKQVTDIIKDVLDNGSLNEVSTAGRSLAEAEYNREAAIKRYRNALLTIRE